MAAIPLFIFLLLGVANSLPQETLELGTTTPEPLQDLQQPQGHQQNTCSIEGLDSLLTLSKDVATIKANMAQQTKNAIYKANLEAREEGQKFESTLWLLNDSITKELKGVDKKLKMLLDDSITKELKEVKSDFNRKLEMVNANAKKFKEQSDYSILEMRRWIASEFSFVKTELQHMSTCRKFKARVGGLQLRGLETGFYFYHQTPMTHSAASKWCKERGMRLAHFETQEEMRVVLENAPNNDYYWVDASDVGFAPGDFRWSDGSKVKREFWYSGDPDSHGAGKETCVLTYQSAKKLLDASCTYTYRPLCEVPREFSGCI